MFGFWNIRKPVGPTSHDVVAAVRRRLPRRMRIGHAGTLDPFADGVLVLCVGPATRLAEYVQQAPKRYRAEITLGITSTTDDPEGERTVQETASPPDEATVREALGRFVGPAIEQIPPAHSAVHVDGRRAYELARAGQNVHLPSRLVAIHRIDVLLYDWPTLRIDVRCGSGTYMRSLARDIGAALGCGGYCSRLTRTEVGAFTLAEAKACDELDLHADLCPALAAVDSLPKVTVHRLAAEHLAQGRYVSVPEGLTRQEDVRRIAIPCGQTTRKPTADEVAVLNEAGHLLAIARVGDDGATLKPAKVFADA